MQVLKEFSEANVQTCYIGIDVDSVALVKYQLNKITIRAFVRRALSDYKCTSKNSTGESP